MAQQVTNFARFYTAVRALDPIGDRDEVKKSLVYQYTDGRTDSLREMTRAEYDRCCEDLERKTGQKDELRKERSATLKLMQKMGVDTTDWEPRQPFMPRCQDNRQGLLQHHGRGTQGIAPETSRH